MSVLTTLHLPTLESLVRHAQRWDDLWNRSDVTHPTARAALVAAWLEQFEQAPRFQALVVCEEGRFLAAIPLLHRRKARVLPCLDVPGNEWSSAGQLMLDPVADVASVCDHLVDALGRLSAGAFWFASIPLNAPWWQALVAAAHRAGWNVDQRVRYVVGRLTLTGNWMDQQKRLSRGFRKQLHRSQRRLSDLGSWRLQLDRPTRESEALRLLARVLSVEHAGWKGVAGTSLLANAQAASYARQQARCLAMRGELVILTLELDQQPIAFEIGWLAKHTYHSYKVGYDPQFRSFGPGQLLTYLLTQRLQERHEAGAIDFLGPCDEATRRWRPAGYPVGRLLLTRRKPLGTALYLASRHWLSGPAHDVMDSPPFLPVE